MNKVFEQIGNHLEINIEPGDAFVQKEKPYPDGSFPLIKENPFVEEKPPLFTLRIVFKEKDNLGQVITEKLTMEQAEELAGKIALTIQEYQAKITAASKELESLTPAPVKEKKEKTDVRH